MKLVERGVGGDHENREQRPGQVHFAPPGANSAQDQQAQYEVFSEVSAFADEVMKLDERGHHCVREDPVENWNDHAARVFRGEEGG